MGTCQKLHGPPKLPAIQYITAQYWLGNHDDYNYRTKSHVVKITHISQSFFPSGHLWLLGIPHKKKRISKIIIN